MADLENLRRKLAGLGSLLSRSAAEEAFDSPGIAMAVSVSPPRSRGASRPRAPAAAAAHPSPPARHFHSTVRAGPPLGASNVRDAPLGGLLAKMKDAEAAWLKVCAAAGGTAGEPKRQGRAGGHRAPFDRPSHT